MRRPTIRPVGNQDGVAEAILRRTPSSLGLVCLSLCNSAALPSPAETLNSCLEMQNTARVDRKASLNSTVALLAREEAQAMYGYNALPSAGLPETVLT